MKSVSMRFKYVHHGREGPCSLPVGAPFGEENAGNGAQYLLTLLRKLPCVEAKSVVVFFFFANSVFREETRYAKFAAE